MDKLPTELLDQIFLQLSGHDLSAAAQACTRWHDLIGYNQERYYERICRSGSNQGSGSNCAPYDTFLAKYQHLHRHLWLVQDGSLWIGDKHMVGSLIETRYNSTSGTMELFEYRAVYDPDVKLKAFHLMTINPECRYNSHADESSHHDAKRALYMRMLRTRRVVASRTTRVGFGKLWPPATIPADTDSLTDPGKGLKRGRRNNNVMANAEEEEGRYCFQTVSPESALRRSFFHAANASTDHFRLHSWISFSRDYQFTCPIASTVQTFWRLDPELLKFRTGSSELAGIWVDSFNQIILICHDSESLIRGVKLTSTNDRIPRGELAFYADTLTGHCRVQSAEPNYTNPEWVSRQLEIDAGRMFIVDDEPQRQYWLARPVGLS